MDHNVKALVLAAGKGTRLQTEGIDLPKVMRQADGHPLLYYVLRGLSFLPPEDIILVVGWKKEKVLSAFPQYPHAVQETLNGTGGAVQYAAPLLEGFDGHLIVCCGDAPMMRQQTFQSLVDTHLKEGNACTMLSARLDEGGSYGRVLREPDGTFRCIVEARDCTPEQAAVTEVNTGTYVFHVPALLKAQGLRVGLCDTCAPDEMLGVNTVEQLRQVELLLRAQG